MNWYLKVLKQYADFKGRARRKEYWMFFLFNMIFITLAMTIGSIIIGTSSEGKEQLNTGTFIFFAIYLIYTLLIITPTLAVSVRRLHDIGQSGWMYLIALIPFVGGIWFFVLLCTNSKNGTNKWGENPKGLGNDTGINQIGTE